jgi:hypothetical protein
VTCISLLVGVLLLTSTPVDVSIKTPHFHVRGAPAVRGAVKKVAAEAESRYERVCRGLGGCPASSKRIDVWVAEDPMAFAARFPGDSAVREWAVGVAFPTRNIIILRAYGSALFSLRQTLEHEISHILTYQRAGNRYPPRWYMEGVAIWQAGEQLVSYVEQAAGAALGDRLRPFSELTRGFPQKGVAVKVAYAQSALFVRWLVREHGEHSVRRILGRMRQGESFNDAFRVVCGGTVPILAEQWRDQLRKHASPWAFFRDGTVFWIIMVVLFLLAFLVTRSRRKKKLALMGEAEAAVSAWAAQQRRDMEDDPPTVH